VDHQRVTAKAMAKIPQEMGEKADTTLSTGEARRARYERGSPAQ
jgi:hypothetical protein